MSIFFYWHAIGIQINDAQKRIRRDQHLMTNFSGSFDYFYYRYYFYWTGLPEVRWKIKDNFQSVLNRGPTFNPRFFLFLKSQRWKIMKPTDDLRVKGYQQLMEPNMLKQELAISPAAHATVLPEGTPLRKFWTKKISGFWWLWGPVPFTTKRLPMNTPRN